MPPYLVEERKHTIYFLKQEMGGWGWHKMIKTGSILKFCHEFSLNTNFNAGTNFGHLRPCGGSKEFKYF